MKDFVKIFDVYPQTFHLKIKGNDYKKTFGGGVLSLCLGIFTVTLILYNLYQFLFDNSPQISSSLQYAGNQIASEINLLDLRFLLFFVDTTSQIEINNYKSNFTYTYVDLKLNNSSKLSKPNILDSNTIKNCRDMMNTDTSFNDTFFQSIAQKNLSFLNLSRTFCFLPPANNLAKIGGSVLLTQEFIDLNLKYEFDLCSNFNCSKLPTNLNYGIIVVNKNSEIKSNSGYNDSLYFTIKNLDFTQSYSVSIILQKNEISTDNNFIYNFQPPEVREYYSVKEVQETRLNNKDFSIKISFTLWEFKQRFFRYYMKFDQVIASTFSVQNLVSSVFGFIVGLIEIKSVEKILINKLYFNKKLKDDDTINIKSDIIRRIKTKNKFVSESKESFKVINKKSNKKIEEYFEGEKIKRESFKILLYELKCCHRSNYVKSLNLWLIGEKLLKIDFDLINIGKKLIEFEKLKEILLDENQISVFKINMNRNISQLLSQPNIDELICKLYKNNSNEEKEDLTKVLTSVQILNTRKNSIDSSLLNRINYF